VEGEQDQRTGNKVNIINDFTKCGVQFSPPTPPSLSYWGHFSNSNTSLSPRFVITSMTTWNMEEMYVTTKRFHQYLGAIGTIELNDFIHEFHN
jgi:hypothetical protein